MSTEMTDIPTLAAEFTAAHHGLDPAQQRTLVAALRLLSEGHPFTDADLIDRADLPLEQVVPCLGGSMIQRGEDGRIIALGGLTLEPTSHLLEAEGRTLYSWCALDTLFLPELLGRPARVRSTCPQTGETISLTVDETGPHDLTPQTAVMTLHDAKGLRLEDVIGTFCCYVHFFADDGAARAWTHERPGTYVVSIQEGFEYGRLYNHGRLGAALEDAAKH